MDNKSIKEKVKSGWLHVRIIQEIAGFPEEKVISAMDQMNGRLNTMDGVEILERKVHETKEVSEGIWSMFAEIELLVKDFSTLILLIFDFMPSSVEIFAPEVITEKTVDLMGAVNDLIGKIHHLDATAKKSLAMANAYRKKLALLEKKKE